ncbi:hypothetical protein KSP39_PZI005808 [Platanthera zijinensis]|uniref:Uncharacterized protein n=1 Tax=Platanthera zijinensis TaxID=2320716 RepID=A0AAP0BU86_9ASPA
MYRFFCFTSLFCYFLRIYVVSNIGFLFSDVLTVFLGIGTFSVSGSGGQIIPSSGPSNPPSSSSWTEDSFKIGVLLEPLDDTEMEGRPSHPPTGITFHVSLESSIRTRVGRLENEGSIFLLDKEKGHYWLDIKTALKKAPSQSEYNRLLEFESRDLQIRELKHECYSLFQQMLYEHSGLAETCSCYNPKEALLFFFNEKRDELDNNILSSVAERDGLERQLLEEGKRLVH